MLINKTFSPSKTPFWAVGGGKGGIGKSFVSSNIAICLTKMGKKVALVDLDLGSANLHTCLGIKPPKMSLSDFISGRAKDLNEIKSPTGLANLSLLSGYGDALDVADLSFEKRNKLMVEFGNLDADIVLLDLGAGTSETMLDFFINAHEQLVVVTPEPTSVENAYRFVKASYFRSFQLSEQALGVNRVIAKAMDAKNDLGIRTPSDLMNYLLKTNPKVGQVLLDIIRAFNINIILNQSRAPNDIQIGHAIKSVCRKYFGIHAEFVGHIDYDNAVWQAVRQGQPLVTEFPTSGPVHQFLKVTKNLIQQQSLHQVG